MNASGPVEDATGGRKLPLANGRRGGLGLSFQDLNSSVKGTDMAVLRHCPAFQAAWRNLGTLARHAVFGPYLKAARRPSLAEHTGLNPATLPAGSPSTRYRADRLSTRGTTARKSCWKLSCALRKYSNMQKCKNGGTKRRVDGILWSSNRLPVPPFLPYLILSHWHKPDFHAAVGCTARCVEVARLGLAFAIAAGRKSRRLDAA